MSKSVFCIAPSETIASAIVSRLKADGFADNNISVLFPDKSTTRDFAHEKNTKAPEGATAGAGAGGVVGGTLGLLAGIGLLAIPGVGPFIAAGPIMAALSGAAVGATLGGVTGALIGMGIPELEAKRYEGKIKSGNILISVHAEESEDVERAKDIFEAANATDISVGSYSKSPDAKATTTTDRTPVFPPRTQATTAPRAPSVSERPLR
jgi:predicted lipid-binding transport protein (Tim44 family)